MNSSCTVFHIQEPQCQCSIKRCRLSAKAASSPASLPWIFWGARFSLIPSSVPAPRSRPGGTLVLFFLVFLLWCTHLDVEHCYIPLTLNVQIMKSTYQSGQINKKYQHDRGIHVWFCHPSSLTIKKKLDIRKEILHVNQNLENSMTKSRKHDALVMQFSFFIECTTNSSLLDNVLGSQID